MSGNAQRLAEAANQISNPKPIQEVNLNEIVVPLIVTPENAMFYKAVFGTLAGLWLAGVIADLPVTIQGMWNNMKRKYKDDQEISKAMQTDFAKLSDEILKNIPSSWSSQRKTYLKRLLNVAKDLSTAKEKDQKVQYGLLVREIERYMNSNSNTKKENVMSGNAQRLAEAANQITNPQPINEAKQLGTVAPFNYNMELLKAMSADEDGEVKFAVSGFMLRIYGKSPSPDLVNFFKKVLNDAGRQYKIVAQSRFDVQYMTPKDTSGLFHGGFEGITVDTGSLIASNKELLDRFGKSVYDAVRKQFTSNSVQVGGAYAGTTSGGFNYGKGLGLSGIDIVRSMSPKGSIMGEAANQIINPQPIKEAYKAGDTVKVPHKGKMVKGKIVRYDDGGTDKARQSGVGYVVDVGEPASIFVPKHKVVKEAANQIDEISKATKDAYVAKRGSQLSSMLSGHTKGKQLTGKQQANAVKGIKQAMGVKEETAEITEAPYTPANDYEGEMAMTQLKSVIEKATETLAMLKPEAKMEAWVQSKITLCDEHISCVRDYLKHTPGSVE
jgi:hypothetical protein